ncbi:MAG TPA: hypothetical protein VNT03_08830 [Baekduia sp.]|nr:hypothetical protein [Baekduia sp.]
MNRRSLQSAASAYPYLRGLLAVPGGLLFVLAALGNWEWGPLRHAWAFLAMLAAIGLAVALVNNHYNEHYGRVTPSARQRARAAAATAVGAVVMFGGSLLLRSRAGWSLDLPVNPIPATFGALMLVYYSAVVGLRAHHVVIWGALLVAGALPLWDGADPSNIGLVLCGAAAIVNGVFDHRLLVRVLRASATPDLDGGHAGHAGG